MATRPKRRRRAMILLLSLGFLGLGAKLWLSSAHFPELIEAEASTSQPAVRLGNSPISTTSTTRKAGATHNPKPGSCG